MESILHKIEQKTIEHTYIDPEIIKEKNIKLGLRNADGSGVIVGITTKGSVVGYNKAEDPETGKMMVQPVEGRLYYSGYDVARLVESVEKDQRRFGFEEVAYLLLTGELPSREDLNVFTYELGKRRSLSRSERRIIMEEVQNDNQMYALHGVISHMSRCDANPDSIDLKDVSRQCFNLIAKFPPVVAYNHSMMRFRKGADLLMMRSDPEMSAAENFLYLLRGEKPDPYEAHLFDVALMLHAEHGGGNNSTFSVRAVSSSGANTYMAISAGIASLSGHLHGGANEHVMKMMADLKKNVRDWSSEREIREFLNRILDKKAGDGSGKLYGFGHAVYTLSDPRETILKRHAEKLAKQKGALEEFELYKIVEKVAVKLISERKNSHVSPNVDYYSGFVYHLLGIPRELYTPIFAMARVVGWSAHRLEQIVQAKIMRPAYISPRPIEKEYTPLDER